MKIIILSFFLTSQAQFIDETITTINYFNLITNQFNDNETNLTTYENDLWSSTSSLDIIQTKIIKQQWININQTKRGNSSNIFWRKINDDSTYILTSQGQCINRMCQIKFKYNGTLSNKKDGCLSFILSTIGQPVGQLWIEEDQQEESFSQKIQLTNSSLRVEHSLRSNIKNLSIDARILFRNSNIDRITLSNLNVNWKGSCRKSNSKELTSISLEYYLTSEYYFETNTLITNQIYQNDSLIKSSTIKNLSLSLNESNILWILSLIILFCLFIILSSFIYGIWIIQGYYHFIWYIPFDYPIQFIARRSIRSSTRSQNKIKTLSQLSNEIFKNNLDNLSINSSTSTSSTFFAYF